MNLVRWSYARRNTIRGYFDKFPNSTFYFRRIRNYFSLQSLDWHEEDPEVSPSDREEMQLLLNRTLGREKAYKNRRAINK
ncbi:hypothetical protein [Pontibacillus yanchengensis]|uniref:Uncharacterized protein n=1 Tax=Pontibacillus yanchengensis Y32 TaxID=1385514 RepID=A0A0A2TFL8_9BACI|nr:hypothetical protein [Pontibacillus yanchengensis]KGP72871.1 hypothetical protein N782_09780 [Pontibacillus yanchengensis Y32]